MAKTPAKAKQTMSDVAPPGTTSAAPTARPVIVGHRSAMKDPMVQDHDETSAATTEVVAPSKKRNPTLVSKTIQPESAAATEKAPDTPEAVLANAEATVGTVVDQFKGGNTVTDAPEQSETTVSELIASRKYIVPIGPTTAQKQANSIAVLILLCLIVGAAGYAWMMGMIPFMR